MDARTARGRGVLGCPRDGRVRLTSTYEVSTVAFDPDRIGVGSSPYVGDVFNSLLQIPATPSPTPETRHLFLLAAYEIPACSCCRIKGIGIALLLGADLVLTDGTVIRLQSWVDDPFFAFPDGNVSYHLRLFEGHPRTRTYDPFPIPSRSNNLTTKEPALLYDPFAAHALANGIPPGRPLDALGTFRDKRFDYLSPSDPGIDRVVDGPAMVALYASVKQTNPATRPNLPPGTNTDGLSTPYAFWAAHPDAVYDKIGARLLVECTRIHSCGICSGKEPPDEHDDDDHGGHGMKRRRHGGGHVHGVNDTKVESSK